jgi:hypothetical protein
MSSDVRAEPSWRLERFPLDVIRFPWKLPTCPAARI